MTSGRRTSGGLPEGRLEERFADQKPLFTAAQALFESSRCLYCHDAPCIGACPTTIDIPTFIKKISTGNTRGAARTILESNLLGASCARVCPVEELCEGSCVYVPWGRPVIPIGRLQRYAMAHGASASLLETKPTTGRSIAVVGAGPASLACAGTLALLGHAAVVHERGVYPGGLNTTGVAPYKLAATHALDEVGFIEELGVEILTGVDVGGDIDGDTLLDTYDAVFLGPGLGDDSRLGVPGEEGEGVIGAVAWIEAMKLDPSHAIDGVRRAVVVGGGNTAVDVTRELLGLGVGSVTMVYRRNGRRMSAYRHELVQAREAGAVVVDEAAVAEVLREGDTVSGVRLVETQEGRPTERERAMLGADLVVVAIGQAKLRALAEQFEGVRCDARDRIVVDPVTFATGNARVFAGGDAVNGGKEVVDAVHDGQAAARAIDGMLMGEAVGAPTKGGAIAPGKDGHDA